MEFRVLGPVEVWQDDFQLEVAAPRQRAILALLLIHAGSVLTPDRILDEIWGEEQPKSGVRTVQFHISKLRSCLDPGRDRGSGAGPLLTRSGGYVLDVEREAVDAQRFERLMGKGKSLVSSEPSEACALLEQALSLWRGEPYVDFAYSEFAVQEVGRLTELRLSATEDLLFAMVEAGRAEDALVRLEHLAEQYPLRERITAALMTALYRVGRQSDALRAFSDLRSRLADELGIDATPELFELEERILLHDPSMRTAAEAVRHHNIPATASSFVDRQEELDNLVDAVRTRRVVTLLGPGGIGKTRLALEVATAVLDHFPDGVLYVDVSNADSLDSIVASVSSAAGLAQAEGRELSATVSRHVATRTMLLLLDACEHVALEVAEFVSAVVASGAHAHVLTTSRQRINVDGEVVYGIAPLPVPSGSGLSSARVSPSVVLLVDRIRRVRADFVLDSGNVDDVALICQRLEGIPLALEIAASHAATIGLGEIATRLTDRLGMLNRPVPLSATRRSNTMYEVIEWSHGLLSPNEQVMLRRLAVFRGGFTAAAAETVCGFDPLSRGEVLGLIERLVDTSFVFMDRSGRDRLRMLDTIAGFAHLRADQAGELAELGRRHLDHFAELAEREVHLLSGNIGLAERLRWLDVERHNYRAACEFAVAEPDPISALRLAAHLGDFWMELGYHGEGRELLAASLDVAPPEASPELMEVLAELAMLELWNGEPRLASSFADRVRATAGALGDPDAVARASRLEATLAWGRGDYRLAAAEQVAALEHLTEVDPTAAAYVTGGAAFLALVTGDDDVAGRLIADLEDAADELDRPELNALRHEMRAWNAFQSGDSKKALESWLTAVDGYASLDLRANLADVLLLACWAATAVEDLDTARRCAGQALDHARALPSQFFVARALAALGWCDVFSGNGESGARLVQKALGETRRTGDRYWLLWNTWQAVRLAARHGDFERAATLVGAAKRLAADVGTVAPEPCRVTISSVGLEARDSLGRSRWQRRQRLGRELGDPELIELLDGYVSTLSAGTYSVDA